MGAVLGLDLSPLHERSVSTPLSQLLAWAGEGWHVFPLAPGSKIPAKGSHGVSDATTDLETITKWHGACPDANWGINAGKSGLMILDHDQYKPGAAEAFEALDFEHGIPKTFQVATPSGGTHYYFKGSGGNSVEKLGKGIDTRGHGGYVVLPLSRIDGKPYTVVDSRLPVDAPEWMARLVGKPAEPKPAVEVDTTLTLDTPAAVMEATHYLQTQAPPAIEGEGGDMKTLHTAMLCKDLGVTQDTAFALMAQYYNPRCEPEWELDELQRKVANAYRYGKNAPGSASIEAAGFTPIELPKPRQIAKTADGYRAKPPGLRPWILHGHVMSGFITATIAQGGVGKSTLVILECLSIATNRALTGATVKQTGPVWYFNGEDPDDELGRRILAAAQFYGISTEDLAKFHVSSGRDYPLSIADSERGTVTVNQAKVDEVCKYITDHGILLLCVDPFVHFHHCEENSNSEMAVVMQAISRIAERTGVAVNLVHHTSKGAGVAGDMDKSRGASSISGEARMMRHVQTMSEDECGEWGISVEDRKMYVGVYEAKANMSLSSNKILWFHKESVLLPSGEEVGTLKLCGLERVALEDLTDVRDAIVNRVVEGCYAQGPEPLDDVARDIKEKNKEKFKDTPAKMRSQIREAFEGGALHVPGTDKRIRMIEKGGKCSLIVEGGAFEWLG